MSTESADSSVNGSSGTGAVNASNVTSVVTAELKNEIQKIVMGIVKEQVPRAVKSAVSETMPDALRTVMGELQQKQPEPQATAVDNPVDADKITQKARIEALEKQLQSFQKQAQDADGRARDASMRSRVQSEVAKFLPASDPNHAAYMGMLYDLQKRFVEADGNPAVKFKREWGDEMVPLEQGVKELFDGELKHLVQHSRAQSLPPAGFRGANGQAISQAKPGPKFNPLLAEVASSIGESRPDFGRALMDAANGVVNGPNK